MIMKINSQLRIAHGIFADNITSAAAAVVAVAAAITTTNAIITYIAT